MRPAIEAELMFLLEAADPYETSSRRKQGNVLPVEILEQSVRDRGRIGKPAHEKETYSAFSAFLFGNW